MQAHDTRAASAKKRRERLYLLSEKTFAYQGQAEKIEQGIKARGKRTSQSRESPKTAAIQQALSPC
jgi:hypothetical protein